METQLTIPEQVIVAENVHKWYGQFHVLRGVSMNVNRGEVVVVMGPSGSGKSTFIRTFNALEEYQQGKITIDGIELSHDLRNIETIRREVGMVFQQFNLFPHLTVIDNVTLASRRVLRMPRADAEHRGRQLLEDIGLGSKADTYPDRLSGGQQQRAAIVRAIATDPDVLLLDEITSSLDPELVGEVLDLVRHLKSSGTTIVMATHEMAFARDVADRVVFLDAGVVAEQGTAAQMFGDPRVARTREFLTRFLD